MYSLQNLSTGQVQSNQIQSNFINQNRYICCCLLEATLCRHCLLKPYFLYFVCILLRQNCFSRGNDSSFELCIIGEKKPHLQEILRSNQGIQLHKPQIYTIQLQPLIFSDTI